MKFDEIFEVDPHPMSRSFLISHTRRLMQRTVALFAMSIGGVNEEDAINPAVRQHC